MADDCNNTSGFYCGGNDTLIGEETERAAFYADLAKDWAIKLGDTVDGIEWSSKHYASQAATSASLAAGYAGEADTSKDAAAASAAAALASEQAAAASEANAATSETNAAASATTASNSAQYARDWAITPEDTLVPAAAGGNQIDDYSALHWAVKAEGSAGTTEWGSITGTLSNQTDLDSALGAKWDNNTTTLGGAHTATGDWDFDNRVLIAGATDNGVDKLQVNGSISASNLKLTGSISGNKISVKLPADSYTITDDDSGRLLYFSGQTNTLTIPENLTDGVNVLALCSSPSASLTIKAINAAIHLDFVAGGQVTVDDPQRATTVIGISSTTYITVGNVS